MFCATWGAARVYNASMSRVVRPIVRSFSGKQLRDAAAHVRRGGHAVVWETPSRARLLVPAPDPDDPMDLALFSILDLGKTRYEISNEGVTKGLAMTRVPSDCNDLISRRTERDEVHAGATRPIDLDCLACGACCRANKVELSKVDIARFEEAGRGRPLADALFSTTRRQAGASPSGRSQMPAPRQRQQMRNLRNPARDVRDFPMASECCLSARYEELGIYDGAPRDQ